MEKTIVTALISVFGTSGLLFGFFYLVPDKFEKWVSIIAKYVLLVFRFGRKRYAAYDIQGRVNEFVNEIRAQSPKITTSGVKIVWLDTLEKNSPLREETKLVVRMRQHEDQDKNFVQASMIFIASEFMRKTKKYLSKSQSESLDLFFARQLFEKEKPHIADKFFDDYFSPATENKTIADLLHQYGLVERVGLFFPVLVQELEHLGEKVYYNPKKNEIRAEVSQYVHFLEKYSHRKVGDDVTPTVFSGTYLRCGIVIIARKFKREDGNIEPYVRHIGKLLSKKIETVYLLGSALGENIEFMKHINDASCERFGMELMCEPKVVHADINDRDGKRHLVENYVVSLRSRSVQRVYDMEYQERYIDVEPSIELIE